MDTFKEPMRAIKQKYTKSQLYMMAWNSREQAAKIRAKYPKTNTASRAPNADEISGGIIELEDSYQLPEGINGGVRIPKKFFDEQGELDLRRASGPEALAYINALGIQCMPIIKM